jgi:3-hydroxyacyl-[acyl-carrier-protein] dehydratase
MTDFWDIISIEPDRLSPDGMTIEVQVPAASPWFSGHFPGNPILPGVALLSIVAGAIVRHEGRQGKKIRLSSLKRVRFKMPVRPDERLLVDIRHETGKGGDAYLFQAMIGEDLACAGTFVALPVD